MEFHNDIKEQIKSDEKRNKSIDEDIKGRTTERIQKKRNKNGNEGKKTQKPIYFTQKKMCCFLLSFT